MIVFCNSDIVCSTYLQIIESEEVTEQSQLQKVQVLLMYFVTNLCCSYKKRDMSYSELKQLKQTASKELFDQLFSKVSTKCSALCSVGDPKFQISQH